MKRNHVVILMALGLLVSIGLALYGDIPEVIQSISDFSPWHWAAALSLASLNYFLRWLRWEYYLRLLGVRTPIKTSSVIFLSGLSMTISPGRVGELAKSYFLKEKTGTPIAVSAPAVLSERLLDMASVLLLGLWGLILVPYGWALIVVAWLALAAFMAILASERGVALLVRLPVFRKWKPFIATSGSSFRKILSLRAALVGLVLASLAWFSEGLAFWMVIEGLGSSIQIPAAVSIYCSASLIGAVSMLPGGLVSTEGGMLAMLQSIGGLSSAAASSATLIIRVCTLWFAVAIGLLALLYTQRGLRKGAGELAAQKEQTAPAHGYLGGDGGN